MTVTRLAVPTVETDRKRACSGQGGGSRFALRPPSSPWRARELRAKGTEGSVRSDQLVCNDFRRYRNPVVEVDEEMFVIKWYETTVRTQSVDY